MGEWIAANWVWFGPMLIAIAGSVGGIIVKATPTKVDDAWWEKIKEIYATVTRKETK